MGQKEVDTLKGIYSNKKMKAIPSYIMYVMNKMELFHNTIHIRCLPIGKKNIPWPHGPTVTHAKPVQDFDMLAIWVVTINN